MGYLAFGAIAGAGKEYLKQSGEERQSKYQDIRDRRLAELTTTENMRAEGVRSQEAATEREFRAGESESERKSRETQAEADRKSRAEIESSKPITLSEGQDAFTRTGKPIASGRDKTFAPSAASLASDKWRAESVEIRGPEGKPVGRQSREQLYKEWEGQAYLTDTDDLGGKIITRDPSIPSWDDWYNARVTDQYRTAPSDLSTQKQNPMELYLYFQNKPEFKHPGGREGAIEIIQRIHPWWQPPELEGGKAKDAAARTGAEGEAWSPGAGGLTLPPIGGPYGPPSQVNKQEENQSGYLMQQLQDRAAKGDPWAQAQLAAFKRAGG